LATLRGGAGIMRLLYPQGMEAELSTAAAEVIKVPYQPDRPEEVLKLMNQATANYVGPGVGLFPQTRALLKEVIPNLAKPVVIDADALTIVAEEKIYLPAKTVLTPHLGEMKRLLNLSEPVVIDDQFLERCRRFAIAKKVTLVLKGGPSFIIDPEEKLLVCPHGDPGMATAGSGDVLTGLIAALLAQGCSCYHAAALGVYLHALAGEYAAESMSSYSMIASDIINFLPDAFLFGERKA
jgi:ADP-dependent NAD(P)H-hydrate dehydratase / NAD(P)H-hydrate epimerase